MIFLFLFQIILCGVLVLVSCLAHADDPKDKPDGTEEPKAETDEAGEDLEGRSLLLLKKFRLGRPSRLYRGGGGFGGPGAAGCPVCQCGAPQGGAYHPGGVIPGGVPHGGQINVGGGGPTGGVPHGGQIHHGGAVGGPVLTGTPGVVASGHLEGANQHGFQKQAEGFSQGSGEFEAQNQHKNVEGFRQTEGYRTNTGFEESSFNRYGSGSGGFQGGYNQQAAGQFNQHGQHAGGVTSAGGH